MPFRICFLFLVTYLQNIVCLNGGFGGKVTELKYNRLNFIDSDLFRYTTEDNPSNVVISPASIKSTLAMILEGADGVTAAEIRSALRLAPTKEAYREIYNYILNLQNNSPETFLQNANAVFVSNRHKVKKEYESVLRKAYLADVGNLNFNNPTAATDIINGWISGKTRGLIPAIIAPVHVNPTTDIIIANALYFKSKWKHTFDVDYRKTRCFYYRGECKNVTMMNLYEELNYAYVGELRAHAVELPYEGGRYSMVLLVPQDPDSVGSLIRDMPHVGLPRIYKLMELTEVQLSMPKFTVDYSNDLVAVLKKLQITTLFSPSSNLTGFFEGRDSAQISNVLHKVHLTVDETGTEAAAATSAMIIPLIHSAMQVTVNYPFAFFIIDKEFGLVLFEGKIEDPTAHIEGPKAFKH